MFLLVMALNHHAMNKAAFVNLQGICWQILVQKIAYELTNRPEV